MQNFNNFLSVLSSSDQIQLFGILVSLFTSLVAIVISISTLRQSSKALEDAAKPYIVVYAKHTNFQSPYYYLIVKNFGQTGAEITSFSCDHDLSFYSYDKDRIPFSHFCGTYIAPGQSYTANINPTHFSECRDDLIFSVSYKAGKKNYKEQFVIHPINDCDLIQLRASTEGKELRTISYALQDLTEKML